MDTVFSRKISDLRRERGLSQRRVAADLHISQALLSHYENAAREPGLSFVCRVCDYYGVSADYILGRTDELGSVSMQGETLRNMARQLREIAEQAEMYAQ